MDINKEIYSFVREDYQKDNFSDFLKKVGFSYDVPSIHISGTNGKTIVASMLANIYKSANYKTGLFISSSSKKDILEMIKINGEPVSIEEVESIYNENFKLFKKYDLSHFEIIVFIALSIFKKEKVDIAVIECGMGGEFDATNVFNPILSIITNIGIEHTDYLGVSLSDIALHKAGIIKNGVPSLIGEIEGDALDVIVDVSKKKNSKVTRIGESHNITPSNEGVKFDYKTYRDIFVPTLSKINVKNACLAIDAVDLLINSYKVDENALKDGLSHSLPKGRFEFHIGNPSFIFDAAHNPSAIIKLREDVDNVMSNKKVYIIFACFKDKNITLMLPEISLLGSLTITTFDNPRAREEFDYFLYLDEYKFESDYHNVVKQIKEENPDSIILFTGSSAFAELTSDEYSNGLL